MPNLRLYPPVGPNRLREFKWEPCTEVKIPADWPSGVYLGRLTCLPEDETKSAAWQSYVIFIVKDDRPEFRGMIYAVRHLVTVEEVD